MNLVAHIVRKDARAIAAPLSAWLALLGLQTIGFALYRPLPDNAATQTSSQIFEFLSERTSLENRFPPLIQGLDLCLVALLVFQVIAEDPVNGTRAFWRTRPISPARLLAAKVTGVVLFFIVAPFIVLGLVWFGLGFSAKDVAIAAGSLWFPIAASVTIAFGIAAIYRQAAGFVLGSVVWFFGFLICQLVARSDEDFRGMRVAMMLLWVLAPAIAARVQFAKPTRRRTWSVLVLGLLAMIALDWQRPAWAALLGETLLPPRIAHGPQTSVDQALHPRIDGFEAQNSILSVSSVAQREDNQVAVVIGAATYSRSTQGAIRRPWSVAPNWGQSAAVSFLRDHTIAASDWRLQTNRPLIDGAVFEPSRVQQTEWIIGWMEPKVAWELPAEAGLSIRRAAERAEIQHLNFDGANGSCFVTERWPAEETTERLNTHRVDVYVLVAAHGTAFYPADVYEMQPLHLNAIAVVVRELRFHFPADGGLVSDALTGAKLVKVEFTRRRAFMTFPR